MPAKPTNFRLAMMAAAKKKSAKPKKEPEDKSTSPARPAGAVSPERSEMPSVASRPTNTPDSTKQVNIEQAGGNQAAPATRSNGPAPGDRGQQEEDNPLLINRSIPTASICWGCRYRLLVSFEPHEVWKCRRAFTEPVNANRKRRLAYYSWVIIPFNARKEDCSKEREARGAVWPAEPKYMGFYSMLPKGHAARRNEGVF